MGCGDVGKVVGARGLVRRHAVEIGGAGNPSNREDDGETAQQLLDRVGDQRRIGTQAILQRRIAREMLQIAP